MESDLTKRSLMMKGSKEDKLEEIKNCINQKDSLYSIHREDAARFEAESKEE